jgi:hypothetical protein
VHSEFWCKKFLKSSHLEDKRTWIWVLGKWMNGTGSRLCTMLCFGICTVKSSASSIRKLVYINVVYV